MGDGHRELVRSPFFDELEVGRSFTSAPAVTLTDGLQAAHAAIVGNRSRLALDRDFSRDVAGGPLANPALVWDISIGQSTVATQHVRANLFYRGLCFSRMPFLGDTLHTTATVEALRENTRRPDRPVTGLAVLRITTIDQERRPVLDYRRCAMLLLSPDAGPTGRRDEIPTSEDLPGDTDVFGPSDGWNLDAVAPHRSAAWAVGDTYDVLGADVVTSAPELARLTGNLARVHHDSGAGGGSRLVYGGHTIGLAFHQVCQAFPELLTVAGWHGCDHVGPVHEGDMLASSIVIEKVARHESGRSALDLRVTTVRQGESGTEEPVLLWRPVVIVA